MGFVSILVCTHFMGFVNDYKIKMGGRKRLKNFILLSEIDGSNYLIFFYPGTLSIETIHEISVNYNKTLFKLLF